MSRWTDIAPWVGPSPNKTPGGLPFGNVRGVVIHIASGFYDGTIAWQRNPDANVSSHFIIARDGRICQMVDTADASWAQKSGNGTWLSIENEGFAADDGLHASHPGWESLTAAQIEQNAKVLHKAHQIYGNNVPLQLATSPAGRGLGHHSMGAENGYDWGHSQCPGTPIKNQKPQILSRAIALSNGGGIMPSEWHTGEPNGAMLTQGPSGYAGQQRDTALAFAWQSAAEANAKAATALTKIDELAGAVAALQAALDALAIPPGAYEPAELKQFAKDGAIEAQKEISASSNTAIQGL